MPTEHAAIETPAHTTQTEREPYLSTAGEPAVTGSGRVRRRPSSRRPQSEIPTRRTRLFMPLTDLERRAKEIERDLKDMQRPIIEKLDAHLREYEGQSFEAWDEAVKHVDAIKNLVRCAGCHLFYRGKPVTIQCINSLDSRPKIQVRAHVNGQRTALYNGVKVPALRAGPIS